MRITVRKGHFEPDTDLQPSGDEVWTGGDEQLPAAILATMSADFEPGTWYKLEQFADLIASLAPVSPEQEVVSAVVAKQAGVGGQWHATIEIGQSQAALMICRSVALHASRIKAGEETWVRVD